MGRRRPGHQVGQERAGRDGGGEHAGHPPPAGPLPPPLLGGAPERQPDRGHRDRVGQRVGPEERVVSGLPHLFRGVPAGHRLDRGAQRAPVATGELRADRVGRAGPAEPAEHGRVQVGEDDQAGLPGGGRVEHSGLVTGPADQGDLQVRGLAGGPGRGDEHRRAGRGAGQDPGERGVGRGEGAGSAGTVEDTQVHDGQRAAGQDCPGDLRRGRQVGAHVAAGAGQGERAARTDRGGAARRADGGAARQQAPVRVVVELLVVALDRGQARHLGAGAVDGDRGKRPAAGVGVLGLGPGARVQRQPAVGRAGQRLDRVVDQIAGRALAGQPPQRGRGRRGHVAPPQPGQPDHDHVPPGGRGAGRRGRG